MPSGFPFHEAAYKHGPSNLSAWFKQGCSNRRWMYFLTPSNGGSFLWANHHDSQYGSKELTKHLHHGRARRTTKDVHGQARFWTCSPSNRVFKQGPSFHGYGLTLTCNQRTSVRKGLAFRSFQSELVKVRKYCCISVSLPELERTNWATQQLSPSFTKEQHGKVRFAHT